VSEAELRIKFPMVPWDAPAKVTQPGLARARYACRYCIAQKGLKGADVPSLPTDPAEVVTHIELVHGGRA
jgi:hypothetical protein